MYHNITCLFALLSCLLAFSASAEVYKWTDAEGRVHFGDKPPDQNAESVTIRGRAKDDAETDQPEVTQDERAAKQRRLLNAFEEERRINREHKEEARKEKLKRQQNCAEARGELENLLTHNRIYEFDKNGNRVFLDGDGRDRVIAEARKDVEYWCGK